jgi:hypothetical protein
LIFPSDEFYKSIQNAMDSIGKYRESLNNMNKSFQDTMVNAMITVASNSLYKYFDYSKIMDGVSKSLSNISQNFRTILLQYGWPPHYQMNVGHMKKIIEAHENETLRPDQVRVFIDETFIEYYSDEKISQLLKSWEEKEWLEKRIPILKEIIDAHLKGMYSVSVPAIFPQVEGIIADGYHHKGMMAGKNLERYTEKLLNNGDEFSYDLAIQEYFLQFVLVGFEHGSPVNSFLSRHAILHGADTEYGTRVNSLKSLLLFDYLQDRFGFVSPPNSGVYHKLGCRVIERFKVTHPTQTLVIFDSMKKAEKAGKSHCGFCIKVEESPNSRSNTE